MNTLSLHRLSLLLLLIVLLPSCAMNRLSQAQRAFSQAATLENEQRFGAQSEVFVPTALAYAEARRKVGKALKRKRKLRKNNLLGNAYTLRALCDWKLQHHSEAKINSQRAILAFENLEQRAGIRMQRDIALMKVLPDLLTLDRIRLDISDFDWQGAGFETALEYYQSLIFHRRAVRTAELDRALSSLAQLSASTGSTTELEAYLVMAQLAGLQTWSRGIDGLRQSIAGDTRLSAEARGEATAFFIEERQQQLIPAKEGLLKELGRLLPGGEAHELYRFWDTVL